MKKRINKTLIILLLTGLLITTLWGCESSIDSSDFNLSEYVDIETSGYNGMGTLEYSINTDELESDILDKYSALSDEQVENLVNSISIEVSQESDLSEGDIVTLSFSYDEDYYNECIEDDLSELTINSEDYEYEVTGLTYSGLNETDGTYILTESDMTELSEDITDVLYNTFYAIDLDLEDVSSIPDDCSVLIIIAPTEDFTDDETDMIIGYIENGGNCIIVSNYDSNLDLTNFNTILTAYGLELTDDYIEDQTDYYEYEYYILPNIEDTDVLETVVNDDDDLLFPLSQGIIESSGVELDVEYTDLLLTSDTGVLIDSSSGSAEIADGSTEQVYSIGKMAQLTTDDETSTIIVYSSYYAFTDDIVTLIPENAVLFYESLYYLLSE